MISFSKKTLMPILKSGAPLSSIRSADGAISLEDFYAIPWTTKCMFMPTRTPWPADSINMILPPIPWAGKKPLRPADWLAKFRRVEQMSWVPGEPEVIEGRLLYESGWKDRPGAKCLNVYFPPTIVLGDPAKAGRWIEHVRLVYPNDHEHLLNWLAQRAQDPGTKPNHAIVLGGPPGIGKDTILAPVREAIGPWNFQDIAPDALVERFNPHVKAVILRISEAHDLGDSMHFNRFAFYEKTKTLAAAPPEVLSCQDKYIPKFYIPNLVGLVITTNHKTDGVFLTADDRRHYVAWSDLDKDTLPDGYFNDLWRWLIHEGGMGHVAAFLMTRDLSKYDPKAPPPKTEAFHDIVHAGHAPEDTDLDDGLDELKRPEICSLSMIVATSAGARMEWLLDRKLRRTVPHRMERCGYVPVRNPNSKQGLWTISDRRVTLYARADLKSEVRLKAAEDHVLNAMKTAGNS